MKRINVWQKFITACLGGFITFTLQTAGAALPSLHFEERGHLNEVSENIGQVTVAIVRDGDLSGTSSARVLSRNRTAIAGVDFGLVDQVVTFAPYQNRLTINIPIFADSILEGNERFRLVLTEVSGGVITDEDARESLYINDAQDAPANDDFAAAIALSGENGVVAGSNKGASREAGEPIHGRARNRSVWYNYTAAREGFAAFRSRNAKFSTLLGVYTGTTVSGLTKKKNLDDSDLADHSDSFHFQPDDSDVFNASYVVKVSPGEVLRIALDDADDSNDDSNDPEDSDDSDDGHGGGGRDFLLRWKTVLASWFEFSAPKFLTNESSPVGRVTIIRRGGADTTAAVRLTTISATAIDGQDYTGFNAEVVFAKGERVRTVDIPILSDTLFEQSEIVNLLLRRPTNGATLGLRRAVLAIRDDDPFTPGRGIFVASVTPPVFAHATTGRVAITVTSLGLMTGNLQFGGVAYPLQGVFNGLNHLTIVKTRGRLPNLTIDLQLAEDGTTISGTVTDGSTTSQIAGARNGFDSRTNPSPLAGRYTLLLPGDDQSAAAIPKGDGWAWLNVATDGTARIAGLLPDGSPFSVGIGLSGAGSSPFYQALYSGRGSLSGAITFAASPGVSDGTGTLHWSKPRAFATNLSAVVSSYHFTPGQRLLPGLESSNGKAVVLFGDGGLATDLSQPIVVNHRNIVGVQALSAVRMHASFNEAHGLFSGDFTLPGSTRALPFRGVVFQIQDTAGGFFLRGTQSGFVRIAPTPPAAQ